MKKNNALMRASGILLVLTLGTSCFVGGTFAKYVSEDRGADTARVAKWGVEVEVAGDAFNTQYGKDDVSAAEAVGTYTVISSNEDNVVAPGTKGSFGGYDEHEPLPALTITGEPEVAVNVNTDATVTLNNWVDADDSTGFYCPLVFTIKSGDKTETVCGLHYSATNGGMNSFKAAIEKAIEETINGDYPANKQLEDLDLVITWEWPFENSDHSGHENDEAAGAFTEEDTRSHMYDQTDDKDTYLGDEAAKDGGSIPTIQLDITTTVTQID